MSLITSQCKLVVDNITGKAEVHVTTSDSTTGMANGQKTLLPTLSAPVLASILGAVNAALTAAGLPTIPA